MSIISKDEIIKAINAGYTGDGKGYIIAGNTVIISFEDYGFNGGEETQEPFISELEIVRDIKRGLEWGEKEVVICGHEIIITWELVKSKGELNMKALVTKTSNWYSSGGIVKEFNTLQELLNFQKQVIHPIIIDEHNDCFDKKFGIKTEDIDFDIEIYDNWRE